MKTKAEPRTRRSLWQVARYLLGHLRGNLTQAVLNTLVGVVLVALDLLFVWSTKLAIDVATHQTTRFTLGETLVFIAIIMVVRILLGIASRWIRAVLGVRAQNAMRHRLFTRLLRARWQQLRRYHTGNLTNRLEQDVADVVSFVTESLPSFVTTCVQLAGAFLFLYFMDSTLALIVVCIVPFFILSSKLYMRRMRALTHERRDIESRVQSVVQETLQHVLVVKLLQRTTHFSRLLASEQTALYGCTLRQARFSTFSSSLLGAGFSAGYFVTFSWGVWRLATGAITYGAMLAFIQLVGQIQGPARALSKFVPVFISSFTAAERLMELERIEEEEDGEGNESSAASPLSAPVGIEVSDVTFSYAPGQREVLSHFSHTFAPGSVTAILGETGSGKTTLIRLLLALHTPQSGSIALTDVRGRHTLVSPAARCNFAYVPQGNTLFSGTVRSNLLLGDPDASEAQLREALHTAAADFVLDRPQGLDAPCGEAGDGLSEGQAQRIAIARALLAAKGGVIVFDEATSALDDDTERTVLSRVVERYRGYTLIFVTHRRAVLSYATDTISLTDR